MRLVGYCRVSTQEQTEGYSLDAQRHAINKLCEREGHELVAMLADEGRSGRSDTLDKRPAFRQAIDLVKAGQADAIIVHKPDRAARNLRVLLQVLHELNGGIRAVEGDFDYTSPEGKLRAHILGSVAQWYSDNLSRECRKGLDQRRQAGLWTGRLPVGYRKQDDKGKLPPVPDTTPVLEVDGVSWSPVDMVRYIFEQTAGGTSTADIVSQLRSIGFDMSRSTTDHIIHNRFYLGEIALDRRRPRTTLGRWARGKHEPIITPELFAKAARIRATNKRGVACIPRKAKVYSLSGLVRCARCRGSMRCHSDYVSKMPWLHCGNRYERGTCDQENVRIPDLEEQVILAFEEFQLPPEWLERGAEILRETRRDTRQQQAAIQRRRRRLLDLYEWGELTKDVYRSRVAQLEAELAALTPPEDPVRLPELQQFLRDLPALYRAATPEQRNELTRRVFSEFLVDGYTLVAAKPRPILDASLRRGYEQVQLSDKGTTVGQVQQVQVSDRLGLVGQLYPRPLPDGWWTLTRAAEVRRGYAKRNSIPREWWSTVAEEHQGGVSAAELAARWNVHPDTVRRTIRRYAAEHAVQRDQA